MKKDNFILILAVMIFGFSIFSFIDVFGDLKSEIMTGKVSEGVINITINPVAMINFTIANIDWGAGSLTDNSSYSLIDTLGNVTNGTWDPVSSGFEIANIGNVNLSISFRSLHDANSFIGGTAPLYQYMISNNQAESCIPPYGLNLGQFYNFPEPGTSVHICEILMPNRSIVFDLNLKIPDDSVLGNLTDNISLSFEQSSA